MPPAEPLTGQINASGIGLLVIYVSRGYRRQMTFFARVE